MTPKEITLERLRTADINKDDWSLLLIESISDLHARGYLRAIAWGLNESLSTDSEDYREELIKVANWDIWGKT